MDGALQSLNLNLSSDMPWPILTRSHVDKKKRLMNSGIQFFLAKIAQEA